jgi:hypothetical protein
LECGCVEIEVKTCKNYKLFQDDGKFGNQMGKKLLKEKCVHSPRLGWVV